MMATCSVPVAALIIVMASRLSFSEESLSAEIGLVLWGNITEDLVKRTLPDGMDVITLPTDTAKSSYTRMEHMYSFLQSRNVLAVVGPYEREVGLATEGLRIPYLTMTDVTSEPRDYTLELSPNMVDIGMAAYDVAHLYSWSKISVFYDDDRGVTLLEKLMTNHTMTVRG
ncbi:hypothetical protein ACOMHN_000385 [Nucella lapillus]